MVDKPSLSIFSASGSSIASPFETQVFANPNTGSQAASPILVLGSEGHGRSCNALWSLGLLPCPKEGVNGYGLTWLESPLGFEDGLCKGNKMAVIMGGYEKTGRLKGALVKV